MKVKSLFNLYLDDDDKKKLVEKLERLNGKQTKGQIAALIRVLLKQFLATPDDKVSPLLIQAVFAEYEYTQKKNKRSML